MGEIGSCYNLGLLYGKGEGANQDSLKAKEIFTQVCNHKITAGKSGGIPVTDLMYKPMGCTALGDMYYYGYGIKQDYIKAREFYTKACESIRGVASACTNLGILYDKGMGVKQDFAKAQTLYIKGCELGSGASCGNLGLIYYQGKNVKQDFNKAKVFFTKSCDLGTAKGCYQLGEMYYRGDGVLQDDRIAYEFLSKLIVWIKV